MESKGKRIIPHGTSYWTRTASLVVELADGTSKTVFLKVWQINNCASIRGMLMLPAIILGHHRREWKEHAGG